MNQTYRYTFSAQEITATPFPALLVTADGQIIEANQLMSDTLGYPIDYLKQNPIHKTIFSTISDNEAINILTMRQTNFIKNMNIALHDDTFMSTMLIFKAGLFNGEKMTFITILPSDFQYLNTSNHELQDVRNAIETMFMTVTIDDEGFIKSCNVPFLKTSNWTPKRVLGKTVWRLFPDSEEGRKVAQTIWDTLNNGNVWQGDTEKMTKDGLSYWVHLTAIPTIDEETQKKQFLFIEKDITKDKTVQLQLEKIAFIDTETGLMNIHRLERDVNQMIEEQKHFSFVYISIDKFYTLKDIHDATSETNLIIEFTKRLKMYFQDSTMARVNEHEFVILTPLPEWFIQGFLNYLIQHPIYDAHNSAIPLSISGGITRYPEDQSSFAQIMKASIASIANVREAGGNNIVSLSQSMQKALNRKSIIEKRLLIALDRKNLQVLYQPQLDLHSGKITAVEALVRWEDEEIGVVAPDELIPVAEETGLINRIGSFMLEQACLQAVEWKNAGLKLKVGINSSVREFRDKNMAKSILDMLAKTNCPAELIQIEITEKFALEAESETSIIKQMRQLENEGIVFSLDDFGTGYASFRYMQLLPIEIIKIDQTFTSSLLKSEKTQRLVDGMIQLGRSMNLSVLAEGVETEEQMQMLKQFGCDYVQGYFLSKPSSPDKIVRLYLSK